MFFFFIYFGKTFVQVVPSSYQLEQRSSTVKSKIYLPFSFEHALLGGVATSCWSFKITPISRSFANYKPPFNKSEDHQKNNLGDLSV